MTENDNFSNEESINIETIDRFMELRSKEMEVKRDEVELEKNSLNIKAAEIESNHKLGEKSIHAQLEDSKLKQEYFLTTNRRGIVLAGFVSLLVFAFLLASMYMGETSFAEQIFHIVIGAIGGFFAGRGTKEKSNSDE